MPAPGEDFSALLDADEICARITDSYTALEGEDAKAEFLDILYAHVVDLMLPHEAEMENGDDNDPNHSEET